MDDIKAQLTRIEHSTARMERAVFGEHESGLTGLVADVKELKNFREQQNLKVAGMAGGVTALVLGAKALFAKLFQ